MNNKRTYLALDVGERRIGVAIADPSVRIAVAYDTIEVDGSELEQITQLSATRAINRASLRLKPPMLSGLQPN